MGVGTSPLYPLLRLPAPLLQCTIGKAMSNQAVSFLHCCCPSAGQSNATWAQVSAFYDHFLSFATLKDFAWSDEHNPAAAPNRKVSIGGSAVSLAIRVLQSLKPRPTCEQEVSLERPVIPSLDAVRTISLPHLTTLLSPGPAAD